MEDLKLDECCSPFLEHFLKYIKDQMILVKPGDRVKCQVLRLELKELYDRCEQDSAYLEKATDAALGFTTFTNVAK